MEDNKQKGMEAPLIFIADYDDFEHHNIWDDYDEGESEYSKWYKRAYQQLGSLKPGTQVLIENKDDDDYDRDNPTAHLYTFDHYELTNNIEYINDAYEDSHYDYDEARCDIAIYVEEKTDPIIITVSEDIRYGWPEEDRYLRFQQMAACHGIRLYTPEDKTKSLRVTIEKSLRTLNQEQLRKVAQLVTVIKLQEIKEALS